MPSVAAIVLGIALAGQGTVGLVPSEAPPDAPPADERGPAPAAPIPGEPQPAIPGMPGAVGLGGLVALLALIQRRGSGLSPAAGLGLEPPGPLFVFVPGHGQPHGSRAFEHLIELAGIDDESIRHFDYRWVSGGAAHSLSSQHVPIDEAVTALNAFVAGLITDGRDVYLVGFSKGGATVAELIADWDDGRRGPSGSVLGAALLDPPISAGALGWLQSAGKVIGPIPDDGGYDPVQCSFVVFGCHDRRAHLGIASGIDVIVIRNPRAAVTSFGDVPAGLRVYDASDGGPGPLEQLLTDPLGVPGRVAAAHESVLEDQRVADCIVAEATGVGTCALPRRGHRPLPGLRPVIPQPPGAHKVL